MKSHIKHDSVRTCKKTHQIYAKATVPVHQQQFDIKQFVETELVEQLSRKLMENTLVRIDKYKEPMTQSDVYNAMLTVVSSDDKFVVDYGDSYTLEDVSFSVHEINKALTNTYPEKFI